MKTNKLTLFFRSIECNGFPSIKIILDNNELLDYTFTESYYQFSILLDQTIQNKTLKVVRYNKTNDNFQIATDGKLISDQTLEIVDIQVDQVSIPEFLLNTKSRFEFDDQIHIGSRFFGPNGTWIFEFSTPIITHILDQKIIHESQYNQDYQYPWSYKLGPTSVDTILKNIKQAQERISKL